MLQNAHLNEDEARGGLPLTDWLGQSERRVTALTILLAMILLVAVGYAGRIFVTQLGAGEGTSSISPLTIALVLIATLIPAIALMVLFSRKLAKRRAQATGMGSGRLHTRLVALFSVIAAVPTVLVAIFASVLLQSGLEFWFSNRARAMLENSVELTNLALAREQERVTINNEAMAYDLGRYLTEVTIDDPRFIEAFPQQVLLRNLSEAAIVNQGEDGVVRTLILVNPYERPLEELISADKIDELSERDSVPVISPERVGSLTRLDYGPGTYLYSARVFDDDFRDQLERAQSVLADYRTLVSNSRENQIRFNVALLFVALLVVAVAIFTALRLADRLLKPVGELVGAAGRIEKGDFTARIPEGRGRDEIAMLGNAFNRMTGRLEEQTGALLAANEQLEARRAFIEAVLSSVTAGVIALDGKGDVLLVNRSAETLLQHDGDKIIEDRALADVSPELAEFMSGELRDATVTLTSEEGPRTLAVKRMKYSDGAVLTFDDVTEQLSDQRRAAWSDIARRIAHEIKNPLTPIQLAAERLQRRYGKEIQNDPETFQRLTETVVRQVGDLRRMVDEFSNFARMPKPSFQRENVHDISRAALFLHEVAHPGIHFSLEPARGPIWLVCDRRQLGQALTNVVKNGVEAIEAKRKAKPGLAGNDRIELEVRETEEGELVIDVTDTGIGLPEDRERLTEPYMTTRVRGTGLGLAIVKKIVEEHHGTIAFLDRKGGGTHVRIALDKARLLAMAGEDADTHEDTPATRSAPDDGEYDEDIG